MESKPSTRNQQGNRRFNHAVSLHVVAAWAVAKLARERAISLEHAAVVADLTQIGGARR